MTIKFSTSNPIPISELKRTKNIKASVTTIRYWCRDKGLPNTPTMSGYLVDPMEFDAWVLDADVRPDRWEA